LILLHLPSPGTHQYYRAGADYTELKDTIRTLTETKNRLKVAKPVIGITYTMMRDNMHELPEAVRLASELGVNQITCGHLDCISEDSLQSHTTFLYPSRGDKECLVNAAMEARSAGIAFDAEPPFMSGEILACEPHPMRVTLFIRADGTVVPCHAMALPPEAVKNLYFKGQPYKYEPILLGNIMQQEIPDILKSTACRQLQQVFGARADLTVG
jgi:MoaA/NifB/PqqE/SkfB family radical SAM enzyme